MVEVKTNIANPKNYGGKKSKLNEYIVIHYTAVDGDSDENESKYFKNNIVNASAHYFVDSDSITLSVPEDYVAYAVGKDYRSNGGGLYYGKCTNANSISIELCDDYKNGTIYPTESTIKNAIDLVKNLMTKYSIPIENVIRHYDVNGKKCPLYWVDDDKWKTEFLERLSGEENGSKLTLPIQRDSDYTQFVKEVQSIIGVNVDGIAGAKTLASTVTISKAKNNKHQLVKPLQRRLNALGYNCGSVDGVAGSKFDTAAKKFQKDNGCTQDGEFTAKGKSWAKILQYEESVIYAVVQTSGSALKIRSQDGRIIGSIPNKTKIIVEQKCSMGMSISGKTYTMAKVTYNGTTGYVAQNYLVF